MEPNKKIKRKRTTSEIKKVETFGTPACLARTHRLIRVERDLEIQFIKVCSQIRLNEFSKDRAKSQRDERISKRHLG